MLGSLFSGISGMMANSQAINVVGNNVANVNTVGFKQSTASFADLLYQSISGTAGSSQVGRGTALTTVETQFAQGSLETTSEPTDLAIGGKGFFIVKKPTGDATELYTRAGQFRFDKMGNLADPSGHILQGKIIDQTTQKAVGVDTNIVISPKPSDPKMTSALDLSVNLKTMSDWKGAVGALSGAGDLVTIQAATAKWPIAANWTATTATVAGATTLTLTTNQVDIAGNPVQYSGAVTAGATIPNFGGSGLDITTASVLADTTQTFTISGFDVAKPTQTSDYSSAVTVYDSNGQSRIVTLYFRKNYIDSNLNALWDWEAVVGAGDSATGQAVVAASGSLVFNNAGVLQGENQPHSINFNFTIPARPNQPINISFGSTSSISGEPKDPCTQYDMDSATNYRSQDGYPPGTLTNVDVDSDGYIYGHYSNGQIVKKYQITLANFSNPSDLTKEGGNLFASNNKTGDAYKYAPGVSGTGKINPNSLEQSNVDLATEFVKMIVAQRGFQANSRVITTSDEILQELMNLKR
jgi:flagellar hook protein FlgE